MTFAPDDVDRLSPHAREEVQEWIALRYLELHTPRVPERRRAIRRLHRRHAWPKQWDHDPIEVASRQTR